jgi:hypothetical protein
MATFIVRVELHDATVGDENYAKLHDEMSARSFRREFGSSASKRYKLPPEEYIRFADRTIDEVLKGAKEAAAATGKEFTLLVTEYEEIRWHNLESA